MKYYNGMGKNVTGYVSDLEKTIEELKAKLRLIESKQAVAVEPEEEVVMTLQTEEIEKLKESPKPKKRVKKVADTA